MNNQIIKIAAIISLGGIAGLIGMRYIDRIGSDPSDQEMYIVLACIAGIVLVLLSDRITSLQLSKEKLEIQLSELKREVKETVSEFSESLPDIEPEKIEEIKTKVSVKSPTDEKDLIEDAHDIGVAMGMLREVMVSYRKSKNQKSSR